MDCRPQCGACCIAPSITSPIPGMSGGKPAGIPCVQLLPDFRCALFGQPVRPAFCVSLRPSEEMCGKSCEEALEYLSGLEAATRPRGGAGSSSSGQAPGSARGG
ncbi:MAG: YkgJ family cysteine cluster protein [Opitutales bacterium]